MSILKEPLVHFVFLGALIFLWFSVASGDRAELIPEGQISISERDAEILVESFTATWGRVPTQKELAELIDRHVSEEVLVREAYALSLDQGDAVVRNRLRQKMMFFTTSIIQTITPDEEELVAYFNENAERFRRPTRLSFEQVYIGDDASAQDVNTALSALEIGADKETFSIRSLLPSELSLSFAGSVDGTFGPGFFSQLESVEPGVWHGPVRSSYGVHVIRVTAREEARLPDLEEVREQVVAEWRDAVSEELTKAQIATLRSKYEIILPNLPQDTSGAQE